jgi:hypothetical protein
MGGSEKIKGVFWWSKQNNYEQNLVPLPQKK